MYCSVYAVHGCCCCCQSSLSGEIFCSFFMLIVWLIGKLLPCQAQTIDIYYTIWGLCAFARDTQAKRGRIRSESTIKAPKSTVRCSASFCRQLNFNVIHTTNKHRRTHIHISVIDVKRFTKITEIKKKQFENQKNWVCCHLLLLFLDWMGSARLGTI